MRFCASMNLKPVPASRDQVCWYAAYLARRLKPSSIKQYLNIVRLLHIEGGHINPCQDNWQLQSTLKGIERLLGSPVQRRSPIDPALLLRIKSVLNDSVLDSHFWAACMVLFFGMLRKSNLLPDTTAAFHRDKHFMRSDFIKAGNFVTLEVKHSKTIQCRERSYTIKLPILNTSLCAFSALLRAFQKLWLPPNSPAFVMDSAGTPLTGPAFNKRLKERVALCGEDPGMFGSHSFRRGSATWALCCGVPGEVVKLWGDWKSSAYLDYLDHLPQRVHDDYLQLFSSCLPT